MQEKILILSAGNSCRLDEVKVCVFKINTPNYQSTIHEIVMRKKCVC